ncbi:hypothetical protein KM043_015308 [Ampulex compressa]|nr:hypothetical protein KM043_015308 [Ampulex compressa]
MYGYHPRPQVCDFVREGRDFLDSPARRNVPILQLLPGALASYLAAVSIKPGRMAGKNSDITGSAKEGPWAPQKGENTFVATLHGAAHLNVSWRLAAD